MWSEQHPIFPAATGEASATAVVTALARLLLLSRWLAGRARGAAVFLGLRDGQLLQVAFWHEADEDAVRLVVPRHAADHGHQRGRVGRHRVGRRRGWRLVFWSGGRLGVGLGSGLGLALGALVGGVGLLAGIAGRARLFGPRLLAGP